MFKLMLLYSEPETFKPIVFRPGLNLILGEANEGSIKTNGVGKSLAIEFLNFALLKKLAESRISLVPKDTFDPDTEICLKFSYNEVGFVIKRSVTGHQNPTLYGPDFVTKFSSLEDATEFFNSEFRRPDVDDAPSFRSMLGPLIRDERSEFKSLVLCHDTNKRIPADYSPHLYLLNIDAKPYKEVKFLWGQLDKIRAATAKIKENIQTLTGKNFAEAKAELNELTSQVHKIQEEIDALENIQGYEIVKDEILNLESTIDEARARQVTLKHELAKIRVFHGDSYIADEEIVELYNQFSDGLGSYIKKQLDEVISFKRKIDDFQKDILDGKRSEISNDLKLIEKNLVALDKQYKDRISLLDHNGILKNLKQTIAVHQRKVEDLSSLSAWMKNYAKFEIEKSETVTQKNNRLLDLKFSLLEASNTLDSLEESILDIHDFVAGNKHCSFDIEVLNTKEVVRFELRIHDDGSHSNEREKVFMYDVALLLDERISNRHPGFLVHDNIFDVDQDTLVKSLNYLDSKRDQLNKKQYVLTINEDKFRPADFDSLNWSLREVAIARFTKKSKFLKVNYQETKKRK